MEQLSPELRQRLERLLGKPIVSYRSIQRGYTPALRLALICSDGTSAFAKIGTTEMVSAWLRQEQRIYARLHGEFLPQMLAWEDDPAQPILLLEDLSDAFWPPPWNRARIDQVLATLAEVAQQPWDGLPTLADDTGLATSWQMVAADPAPFLSLGMASQAWLERALPVFLSVDGHQAVRGTALLHMDVRSDNICFRGDRAVLIDWNGTCLGNAHMDIAAWLPSLEMEGGPPPETILPEAGELAAVIAGYFAARAGLPIIPNAPLVRQIQLQQLQSALPWAARVLGLPPLF